MVIASNCNSERVVIQLNTAIKKLAYQGVYQSVSARLRLTASENGFSLQQYAQFNEWIVSEHVRGRDLQVDITALQAHHRRQMQIAEQALKDQRRQNSKLDKFLGENPTEAIDAVSREILRAPLTILFNILPDNNQNYTMLRWPDVMQWRSEFLKRFGPRPIELNIDVDVPANQPSPPKQLSFPDLSHVLSSRSTDVVRRDIARTSHMSAARGGWF